MFVSFLSFVVMLCGALIPQAEAAESNAKEPRIWAGLSFVGAAGKEGTPAVGGGFGSMVALRVGSTGLRAVGVALHFREIATNEGSIGTINVDARWPAGSGPYAIVGVAHHHESLYADALDAPVSTMVGMAPNLVHRAGVDAGIGWDLAPTWAHGAFAQRLRPTAQVRAVYLPGSQGPPMYVFGELGMTLSLGRMAPPVRG